MVSPAAYGMRTSLERQLQLMLPANKSPDSATSSLSQAR